jgi:hypothetical protein
VQKYSDEFINATIENEREWRRFITKEVLGLKADINGFKVNYWQSQAKLYLYCSGLIAVGIAISRLIENKL